MHLQIPSIVEKDAAEHFFWHLAHMNSITGIILQLAVITSILIVLIGGFFFLFKEWTGWRNRCLFYLIMKTMSNAVYYFRLKAKSHNKYLVCACICVQMVEPAFLNTLPLIMLARLSAWLLSKHFCVF